MFWPGGMPFFRAWRCWFLCFESPTIVLWMVLPGSKFFPEPVYIMIVDDIWYPLWLQVRENSLTVNVIVPYERVCRHISLLRGSSLCQNICSHLRIDSKSTSIQGASYNAHWQEKRSRLLMSGPGQDCFLINWTKIVWWRQDHPEHKKVIHNRCASNTYTKHAKMFCWSRSAGAGNSLHGSPTILQPGS